MATSVKTRRAAPKSAVERRIEKIENSLFAAAGELVAVRREVAKLVKERDRASTDLVGVQEAAEILKVKPDLVSTWMRREKMPEPLARLSAGPVWSREQIVDWKKSLPRTSTTR